LIEDFSNYNINFCVAPFASDKLFEGVQNLVSIGFRKIKMMFLYEKLWSQKNFHNLCRELLKVKNKFYGKVDINIFHPYTQGDNECGNDFLESFTFLPS